MAPQKEWFQCALCGRDTERRHSHTHRMHVKRCKKFRNPAEPNPSQQSVDAADDTLLNCFKDVQVRMGNGYLEVGDTGI